MLKLRKSQTVGLIILGVAGLLSACTHRAVHQVGSHKVTVARHGFQKSLGVSERGGVPTFDYEGVSTAGTKMRVVIAGDRVKINNVAAGGLREGDSVLIGDEGVAVNSLDYGESAKYLRANSSADELTQTSALR